MAETFVGETTFSKTVNLDVVLDQNHIGQVDLAHEEHALGLSHVATCNCFQSASYKQT